MIPFHPKYTKIDHPYGGREGSGGFQRLCKGSGKLVKAVKDCKVCKSCKSL